MGANHATLRRSRGPSPRESSAQLPRSSSFAERLLPRCLMPEKSREYEDGGDSEDHGAEQGVKGRLPTLEEWLLASPGVEGQLHRRQSPKVCPLSPSVVGSDRRFAGAEASTPSCEDHGAEQGGKGRLPTLEEWLLVSPAAEEQLHRRQSPKVCPLSPLVVGCNRCSTAVNASTPNSSSAAEHDGSCSFSRSESGRRRRVKFRLPAEGDIIVISSTTDCESN